MGTIYGIPIIIVNNEESNQSTETNLSATHLDDCSSENE